MLCDGQNSRNLVLLREFGFESPFSQFDADKKKKNDVSWSVNYLPK